MELGKKWQNKTPSALERAKKFLMSRRNSYRTANWSTTTYFCNYITNYSKPMLKLVGWPGRRLQEVFYLLIIVHEHFPVIVASHCSSIRDKSATAKLPHKDHRGGTTWPHARNPRAGCVSHNCHTLKMLVGQRIVGYQWSFLFFSSSNYFLGLLLLPHTVRLVLSTHPFPQDTSLARFLIRLDVRLEVSRHDPPWHIWSASGKVFFTNSRSWWSSQKICWNSPGGQTEILRTLELKSTMESFDHLRTKHKYWSSNSWDVSDLGKARGHVPLPDPFQAQSCWRIVQVEGWLSEVWHWDWTQRKAQLQKEPPTTPTVVFQIV